MLSESEIWRIIEGMNWMVECNNYRSYYKLKEDFMKKYPRDIAKEVSSFVGAKKSALKAAVNAYEDDHGRIENIGGDDSFDDITAHAVGNGEVYYNAVLANPKLLDKLDYVESFAYALPYNSDYDEK